MTVVDGEAARAHASDLPTVAMTPAMTPALPRKFPRFHFEPSLILSLLRGDLLLDNGSDAVDLQQQISRQSKTENITARRNRNVLLAGDRMSHWRSTKFLTRIEVPQWLS